MDVAAYFINQYSKRRHIILGLYKVIGEYSSCLTYSI